MDTKLIAGIVIILALIAGGLYFYNTDNQTATPTDSQDVMTEEGTLDQEGSEDLETEEEEADAETEAETESERESLTIELNSVDEDFSQTGTAELMRINGKTQVLLEVSETPELTASQPAHIHAGSCPGIGDVAYPLTNVENGESVTMLDVTLEELQNQYPLAINVHKSAEEIGVYTACGDLE